MPKCLCCQEDCFIIISRYCEACANIAIEIATNRWGEKAMDEIMDYVKNINEGKECQRNCQSVTSV